MVDNKKVGKWLEYWQNQQLKRITTYNKKGQKVGESKEYYNNGQLKNSGNYGIKEVIVKYKCFDAETFAEKECEDKKELEIKVGKWNYFNINGEINTARNK